MVARTATTVAMGAPTVVTARDGGHTVASSPDLD